MMEGAPNEDQCGYSTSRLFFPLATVADFLIVYLRNKYIPYQGKLSEDTV